MGNISPRLRALHFSKKRSQTFSLETQPPIRLIHHPKPRWQSYRAIPAPLIKIFYFDYNSIFHPIKDIYLDSNEHPYRRKIKNFNTWPKEKPPISNKWMMDRIVLIGNLPSPSAPTGSPVSTVWEKSISFRLMLSCWFRGRKRIGISFRGSLGYFSMLGSLFWSIRLPGLMNSLHILRLTNWIKGHKGLATQYSKTTKLHTWSSWSLSPIKVAQYPSNFQPVSITLSKVENRSSSYQAAQTATTQMQRTAFMTLAKLVRFMAIKTTHEELSGLRFSGAMIQLWMIAVKW